MQDWADQNYVDEQVLEIDPPYQDPEPILTVHYILGAIIGLVAMAVVYVAYPEVHHWAFLPISLNAIILSPVLFTWLIGKRDAFDPLGLASVYMMQLLVVSALLRLGTGSYYPPIAYDPEGLLGRVSFICLLTLIPFFLGYKIRLGESLGYRIFRKPKILDFGRLRLVIIVMLVCAILARTYAFVMYRGLLGTAFERKGSFGTGKGVLVMIADALCTALVLWFSYRIALERGKGLLTRLTRGRLLMRGLLISALIVMIVGLRGSRSLIMSYLLWVGGIYHFSVKRVKPLTPLIIFICLDTLLHGYKMYKMFGREALTAVWSPTKRVEFERRAGFGLLGTLMGDLGRIHMWMFIKQEIDSGRYPLQFGRTYLAASLGVIPRAIWPTRPYGMNQVLTDMQHGRGAYKALQEKSAMIGGVFGESYANFGILGPFLGMFFYGVIIRTLKTVMNRCSDDPLIAFLLPFVTYLAVIIPGSDSGVFVFAVLKFLGPAILAVWLSRVRTIEDIQPLEYVYT